MTPWLVFRNPCVGLLSSFVFSIPLMDNDEAIAFEGRFEGSATLKSKVFGAKKAKEKQENVTGFSEERKRKGKVKKQTWVLQ